MFSFAMPGGDFTALDQNGELVALTSYGFFNAELRGTNGEELNLKPGTTAEVQFRIPESMRNNAPAIVPLWYFDETAGTWKYDSELNRNGIFYKGKVSHFSSWNCDYYGPTCTVIASAVDCYGNPAPNATICLNQRCGTTDETGKITFVNAPADIPVVLSSLQGTFNIGIVGEGNTYTLSEPILAGVVGVIAMAQYWLDSVEVYTFGTQSPVQYSLDGQNWQTESLFTNVPFQDSLTVWIKDASACPIQRVAYYTRERLPYLCTPPQNSNEIQQYSFNINNLPTGNIPVYTINGCLADSNQLAYICERYICLAQLQIFQCGITTLPAEIGNLSNLQDLYLRYNQLTALPAEIWTLSTLKWLSLDGNQLTALPAEIGNLSNLQTLVLNHNQLTALPTQIGNLSNLKLLNLDGNKLIDLPAEISNLSNLQTLNLHGNQLTVLPAGIGNLNNLKQIWLNNNKLTALPAEIGNLSNLKQIYLDSNQLMALPAEIANLADTLQTLYLQNNPIPVQDRQYYQSLLPNTSIYW